MEETPPARPARKGGKAAPKPTVTAHDSELWEAAGAHCSANERRADEASRDVEAWLKCRFMRDHLGEEYSGTVSAVTSFGVFVTLDDLYVEGLVHITELGGEYFRFDEARQELRGERSGLRYVVGSRVRVQVSRVDLDGRKIDFRMVREGDSEQLLSRGRKPGSATQALKEVQAKDRQAKGARAKAVATRAGTAGKGKRETGKAVKPRKAR
jgi:ribonuclease R